MNGHLRPVVGIAAITIAAAVGVSMLAPRADVGAPQPTSSPAAQTPAAWATLASPGPLSPGPYVSRRFEPTLRFEVPAGWSNVGDDSSVFALKGPAPSGVYCYDPGPDWGESCAIHQNVITVTADRVLGTNAEDCEGFAQADGRVTAEGMIAALVADPRLDTRSVHAETVGGLTGHGLEVRLAESWTGTCKWSDGERAALILTAAHPPGPFEGLIDNERMSVILLDSPAGVISITSNPGFPTEVREVIDTFEFTRQPS